MSTYLSLFDEGRQKLSRIMNGQEEARRLLLHAFGIRMNELLLHYTEELPETEGSRQAEAWYRQAISRRAAGEPLQYITGEQNFCGLDLQVNEHVLIPRQDTEILVEKVLEDLKAAEAAGEIVDPAGLRVLDACTGSGCIAIALKALGGFREVFACDISREALKVADRNAEACGLEILFYESDMFSRLDGLRDLDLITCNPPYIETSVLETLSGEVRDHEPRIALDGGPDGLLYYRILAAEAGGHLKPGGRLYLEIGYDQAEAVKKLLENAGFGQAAVTRDLAGLDRVVSAVWEPEQKTEKEHV